MKTTVTKQELVAEAAAAANISRTQAMQALEAFMNSIKKAVAGKKEVQLRGFGTFKRIHRQEKTARDIARNTPIIVPAHDIPGFKPSKGFERSIK